MGRDPDLERQILPAVEAFDPKTDDEIDLASFAGHSDHQASYQAMLLTEAGFIKASQFPDTDGVAFWWVPERLTMVVHEYLDTIRAEEVWRRTKECAQAVGSVSLDALAKGLVRAKIRKHTGIEVDL